MKRFYRIISYILAVALLLPYISLVSFAAELGAQPEAQSTKSISNDYMEFSVNEETGFFSIQTLEGHPQKSADNDMSLLYDGESIETSFTTVRVDGKDYIFGQNYGLFDSTAKLGETTVDAVNNIVSTEWVIHGITVTQKAQLSRTDNTMLTGNVRLSYEIENTSDETHTVGIRVMLDNSLGMIDAPVTMVQSELAPIVKETEFFSDDCGNRDPGMYIRYLDSSIEPTTEAYITFSGQENPEPDKMIVGHWYHLASSKWDYSPDTDFSFDTGFNSYGVADTATALYWEESSYEPGNTVVRSVTYGVGEFTEGNVNGDFNISMELEGTLEYGDNKKFKNNVVTATIHIYNNVDGSVDLDNAVLSLVCEDGLTFAIPTSSDYIMVNDYTHDIGFIAAGTVESYTVNILVSEPSELKALEVSATLIGNSETNTATVSKYIIVPAYENSDVSIAVDTIEAQEFHITGQRVMSAFGTFPVELLQDRTRWKAAFVNVDYPSIRYEIDHDGINIVSSTRMVIQHSADMVEGRYCLEIAFLDDEYKALLGNFYKSSATINIVDDASLAVNQYGILIVLRTGISTAAKYSILSFVTEAELAAFRSTVASNQEILLVIRGAFVKTVDEHGNIIGYSAIDDFTINGIVYGETGSSVDYINYNSSSQTWDGVAVNGKGTASIRTSPIYPKAWQITLYNYSFYSLTTDSVQILPTGDNYYVMDIIGGIVRLKYGVLRYDQSNGYYITFGGKFSLSGYAGTTGAPAMNETGFDPTTAETPTALKANKEFVYASAEISDIIFNKDGFVGVDTTLQISVAASNILRSVRRDTFMLMLHIDTIHNEYGGKITFPVSTASLTLELAMVAKTTNKGKFALILDTIEGTATIPATAPIEIWPPILGLTQLGFGFRDLASFVPGDTASSDEMVEVANSTTFSINASVGLVVMRMLQATGMFEIGPNHYKTTTVLNVPELPGLSFTTVSSLQWKFTVKDDEGNVVSPWSVAGALSARLNIFSVLIAGGAVNVKFTGDESSALNFMPSAGISLYGGIYVPEYMPIFGGLELLGATGSMNEKGCMATANAFGCDFSVAYSWSDKDVVMTSYSLRGDSSDSKVGVTNMSALPVETVESGTAQTYRLARSASSSISANITGNENSNTVLGIYYTGTAPDMADIALTIDGVDYPLTAATKAGNYSDGNCLVMEDRIIIGVKEQVGKHTYTLTVMGNIEFSRIEALAFAKSAEAKSVAVNSDDSITVTADGSLKNSTVQLYYTNSKTTYDNIVTEPYTDENGDKQILVYKMVDGEKVLFDEEMMANVREHCVYSATVTDDVTSVTVSADDIAVGDEMDSGEYYIMAVVISPHKKVTRAYDDDNSVSYTNANEPNAISKATLTDIGDETLKIEIEDAAVVNYEGYFIDLYNETDGEYVFRDTYFEVGDEITFEGVSGKSYHAEIVTAHVYDKTKIACSSSSVSSSAVTLHTPVSVNASLTINTKTQKGTYIELDGSAVQVDYTDGNYVSFTATVDEEVYGCFIIDEMETTLSTEKKKEFTYSGEFDDGKHSVEFKAVNSYGDATVTEPVLFAVDNSHPSILLENAIAIVEDGKITFSGFALNTKTLTFMGKTYNPAADGSFTITEDVTVERFANRYSISAEGYAGQTAVTNLLAVNTAYKAVDRVDIWVDGVSVDSIVAATGETLELSAIGYAGDDVRNMDDAVTLTVVNGNNVAVFDSNGTLHLTALGTAYVKAVYNMGTYIDDERTTQYQYEDMIEIQVKNRSSDVTASIPDGAIVSKGTTLTLSGSGSIYYTTDGTEPTESSTLYTGPITIDSSVTIKARCYESGCIAGNVLTLSYTVKSSNPGTGASTSDTTVKTVITSSATQTTVDTGYPVVLSIDGDGVIYYTTDGTTPNKNSTLYDSPIYITDDTVIKAVVWKEGDLYSKVYTFTYKVNARMLKLNADAQKSLLLCGYPDGTFRPDAGITRAEAATLLRRATTMYGYYVRDDIFTDVEMWAKQSINELAAAEVVKGYPDGTFRPNNTVTRAEFVAMLMRVVGEQGGSSKFADVQGHWAESYIAKATEYGYISGYPDGTFRPDANITRAEALKVVSEVFGFSSNGTDMRFTDVPNTHWAFGYIAD